MAVYGHQGRTVAAVAVNMPRWLPGYQALIEAGTPFPPDLQAADGPAGVRVMAAGRASVRPRQRPAGDRDVLGNSG